MSRNDEHHFTAIYRGETRTGSSIKVEIDGEVVVLPISQTDYTEDADIGEEIDVLIPEWLAEDRGLL